LELKQIYDMLQQVEVVADVGTEQECLRSLKATNWPTAPQWYTPVMSKDVAMVVFLCV